MDHVGLYVGTNDNIPCSHKGILSFVCGNSIEGSEIPGSSRCMLGVSLTVMPHYLIMKGGIK